jgi:anion-transporting  ArsA/GET3 family ATPase
VDDIFARRLIIQTGKGGTGKTTISAALAVAAAARGKRVLLVEVDTHDRLAPLFGVREPVGYEVRKLRDGIFAINLDPELVILDFFRTHIKIRSLYKQIAESSIFKYFYEAAPGLKELICMGKVWRILGERRGLSGKPEWDCVILDAPATGHGVSLLHIAQAATETLFGPMRKNAEKIRDMLIDPRLTVMNIVAIPEEMPVNEAAELYRTAIEKLKIPLGVCFLNAMIPPLFEEAERAAFEAAVAPGSARRAILAELLGGDDAVLALARAAKSREERAALALRYEAKLREAVALRVVAVPFVFDADFDVGTLEAVACELEKAFAAPLPAPKRAAGHEGAAERHGR